MSLVDLLYKWQTLVGAILGGVFALAVALIVARDARLRAERSAAVMMIRHLVELIGAWNHAQGIDNPRQRAQYVLESFPRLPHDYASMFSVLSFVHKHVAGHLHAVEYMSRGMTRMLAVHSELLMGHRVGANPELDRAIERNDRFASDWLKSMSNHAACAVRLIELFTLSRLPTWHRLRVWARPAKLERICRNAIESGTFRESAFEAGGWAKEPK